MNSIKADIPQSNIKSEIIFTDSIFKTIKEKITDYKSKQFLFAIDSRVFELYEDYIFEGIADLNAYTVIIPNGEENKNINSVFKIIDKLMNKSFNRKDYVIALGGGVVGDITGFAASLFKRGINLIQAPTTLLSMFDSSVGGKTGVDYMGIKNGIGTFYSGELVLVDSNFLKTLEKKEILSGFFEGLKHSILQSEESFQEFCTILEYLSQSPYDSKIDEIICKNIKCKLGVVESDPLETLGKRKVLNYGHTFGHALETHMNFKLAHGVCIGFGIIFANILAEQLGFLDSKTTKQVSKFIKTTLKDIELGELDFDTIMSYMKNDKKNDTGKINFILIKKFGDVFIHEVDENQLKDAFDLFVKEI